MVPETPYHTPKQGWKNACEPLAVVVVVQTTAPDDSKSESTLLAASMQTLQQE